MKEIKLNDIEMVSGGSMKDAVYATLDSIQRIIDMILEP